MLSEKYMGGGGCLETLAATCEQGVGVIVKWKREVFMIPSRLKLWTQLSVSGCHLRITAFMNTFQLSRQRILSIDLGLHL
jgi:hypothetical protein